MKRKIILHYFSSFIVACSVIFIINIAFMRTNIYNKGALYDYHPEEIISSFKNYIYLSENKEILVNNNGINLLEKDNMGIQILDNNNNEVYAYQKPSNAPLHYSNVAIINTYTKGDNTLFLEEKVLNDTTYTYLLFLDKNKVNRVNYSYDVTLVKKAHQFLVLIVINVVLILIMSFLFTLKITKPINRIVDKIENLYKGNYKRNSIDKGIYFEVEDSLNELCDRLNNNEIERKKLEEMKEDWISNITHDIKTPLTSIIGNAEIIADIDYEMEDKTRVKYCNTIISRSEYIKTLVEDLNLSTRLKNNTLVLNKNKVNIVSLIRHILIDIINDEKYNYDNIAFNYSDEEILLNLDEQLIKRVMINLITNAFVHNNNDVKIVIKIEKIYNNKVHISISDNGKGVSEEELRYIFKRYYRGTNTRKKIEGSGLGMAIAHDIVKAHGSNIEATSKLNEGLIIDIIIEI
ncbi:sensor histidine kinase [Romboutsia sp.]|uniref:sensor histidine kinase n=1 Tax=Romboutsia sp. TaxID=1965302 RepID=UPI003F32A23B